MNGTKGFFGSATIWGALIAILSAGLGFLGYQVSDLDQAQLVEYFSTFGAIAGGLVAIFGRVRASKAIGPPSA